MDTEYWSDQPQYYTEDLNPILKKIKIAYETAAKILEKIKTFYNNAEYCSSFEVLKTQFFNLQQELCVPPYASRTFKEIKKNLVEISPIMGDIASGIQSVSQDYQAIAKILDIKPQKTADPIYGNPHRIQDLLLLIFALLKQIFINPNQPKTPLPQKAAQSFISEKDEKFAFFQLERLISEYDQNLSEEELKIDTILSTVLIHRNSNNKIQQKLDNSWIFFQKSLQNLNNKVLNLKNRAEMYNSQRVLGSARQFKRIPFSNSEKLQIITTLNKTYIENINNLIVNNESYNCLIELAEFFKGPENELFCNTQTFSNVFRSVNLILANCCTLLSQLFEKRFLEQIPYDIVEYKSSFYLGIEKRSEMIQSKTQSFFNRINTKVFEKLKEIDSKLQKPSISVPMAQMTPVQIQFEKRTRTFEEIQKWKGLVSIDDIDLKGSW